MIAMSLREAADAVSGQLSGADEATAIDGEVVHDSRRVRPGDVFVAIRGENFDGHDFVVEAQAAGAVVAVVDHSLPGPTIQVRNTTVALGELARHALAKCPEATVVGLTGSNGKTSTKDLLAHILAGAGPTVAPPGSFNNELGLPMTVLSITESTRYLVLEMGARDVGHIQRLCEIAPPDVALVLNIGSAHVGEFGTIDDTARAKGELVQALAADGIAVLNTDDERVGNLARHCSGQVLTFGRSPEADVQVVHVDLDALARPKVTLRIGQPRFDVQLRVHGEHQAINAAAAAAAALAAGVAPDVIAQRLADATVPSRWRMEVTRTVDGTVIVNDAYNANPDSMAASLRALAAIGQGRRTWAVLGEMLELGGDSVSGHTEIGRLAARLGVDHLIGVGEAARPLVMGALSEGFGGVEAIVVADRDHARNVLLAGVGAGDVVVVKASRGIGLESLAQLLIEDHGGSQLTETQSAETRGVATQ